MVEFKIEVFVKNINRLNSVLREVRLMTPFAKLFAAHRFPASSERQDNLKKQQARRRRNRRAR